MGSIKKMTTKSKLAKNKKGFGIIIMVLVCFIFLLVLGTFYTFSDPYLKRVYSKAENYVDSNASKQMIANASSQHSSFFDAAFLFCFIGVWAAGLIIGYYSEYGRFALLFMIFLMAIVLIGGGKMTDYWTDHLSERDGIASRSSYPSTYYILDHLSIMMLLVLGSSIFIVVLKDNE